MVLKQLAWKAATSTTQSHFDARMEELKKEDNATYDWLVTKPPIHWSRSHFGIEVKCDMLLNNLCESFNAAIITARDKPILSMLEDIRVYLMRMLNARRQYMERWTGEICLNAFKILEKNKYEVMACMADWAGLSKFEIKTMYSDQ